LELILFVPKNAGEKSEDFDDVEVLSSEAPDAETSDDEEVRENQKF